MANIVLDGLQRFSRWLGIKPGLAGDALHSEAAARLVLSRRGFLGASVAVGVTAALVQRQAFSFARSPFVGTPGNIYLSLHTADPGALGADEVSYAGYARVAVARSAEAWAVTSQGERCEVRPRFPIDFPAAASYARVSHVLLSDHRGRALASMETDLRVGAGTIPRIEPAISIA